MLRIQLFAALAVALLMGGNAHSMADSLDDGALLRVNVEETGVYQFCLSFEDARIERDARQKAIDEGMNLAQYLQVRPNTRCYRNNITFIPLNIEPELDGFGYIVVPDLDGDFGCPGAVYNGQQCTSAASPVQYIRVQLLYGKLQFPVYVELTTQELVE